eukprot:2709534-Amphidinium_carterae.1
MFRALPSSSFSPLSNGNGAVSSVWLGRFTRSDGALPLRWWMASSMCAEEVIFGQKGIHNLYASESRCTTDVQYMMLDPPRPIRRLGE